MAVPTTQNLVIMPGRNSKMCDLRWQLFPLAYRAEHEICVENYLATYSEAGLKALFYTYNVPVVKIRIRS